jgi:hypothetical protein
MNAVFSLCGYDVSLIDKVGAGERAFFVVSAILSLLAAGLAGAGMGYGAVLTVGILPSPLAAVAAAAFVMNLLRLQHAGSGYPLHAPIEDIHAWRPALAGVVVLFVFGCLIVQPLVFLVERPFIDPVLEARAAELALVRAGLGLQTAGVVDHGFGLLARGRAAYSELTVISSALTVVFALLVAGPALLRVVGVRVLRHYESERWITERIVVDDEWAWARECIEETLVALTPNFHPPLTTPFADPPYNTRPLIFGIDPKDIVEGRLRFTRVSRKKTAATPAIPASAEPWWSGLIFSGSPLPDVPAPPPPAPPAPPVDAPAAAPTPSVTTSDTPTPPTVTAMKTATATATATATPPTTATATPPTTATTSLTVGDVSGMSAKVARENVRAMAVCARYLDLPPGEVLATLRAADDDALVRGLFPAWSKLSTILPHRADVALLLGLAPVVAVVVGRDADAVERRLRAVPGESRLEVIFAPELARRLLRERRT